MQRRHFLVTALNAALAAALPLRLAWTAEPGAVRGLAPGETRALGAVLEHLLPSGADSPGAREVNAPGYVLGILAHPRTPEDERRYLRDGLRWLAEFAPATPFEQLAPVQREAVLRGYAGTPRGEGWLSTLLGYAFEALFGDPAYGGNPGGIGWRWIEHRPGFPRPTPDTIYGKL